MKNGRMKERDEGKKTGTRECQKEGMREGVDHEEEGHERRKEGRKGK